LRLQAYYDRTERDQPGSIRNTLDTFDVEFEHGSRPAAAHHLLWGGGFRRQQDRVENISPLLAFRPANRNLNLTNVFVQDEIELRERLDLTLGLKLEHNSYTGLEYLPNLRLAWKPARDQLVWGALSRAVRAPSRVDREFFSPANPPFVVVAGGANFDSEISKVAELGYRAQPTAALSYSATLFHHRFERLRSLEPSAAGPVFDNKISGRTTGVEMWGSYRVTDAWRLSAGGVRQSVRLQRDADSADIGGLAALGNDQGHWWTLRSSFDLGPKHELDVFVRHVGALPNPAVPSYTAVNARIGWRVQRNLELSLTAQNLFDPGHAEWGAAAARPEFERSVYASLLWRM
jgi:iron complex outermembrane receptor protein